MIVNLKDSLFLFLGGIILKKKIIIILILLIILIGIIFSIIFYMNMSKNSKNGNNTSSQDIVNNILNIKYYETKIEVEINSNKNTSKYIIKQKYKEKNETFQEILEPANIAGVKITKKDNKLKIENTNLNLSSIFENYEYVSDNMLDLSSFIQDYKSDEKSNWNEEKNQIIMTTNQNGKEKKLYIDKTSKKPFKLEIIDINKNNKIYISYNEIDIK